MLCVHVGQRKEGDMEWKGNEKNRKVAWRKWVVGNYTPQQYVPGICRHTYALGISEKKTNTWCRTTAVAVCGCSLSLVSRRL